MRLVFFNCRLMWPGDTTSALLFQCRWPSISSATESSVAPSFRAFTKNEVPLGSLPAGLLFSLSPFLERIIGAQASSPALQSQKYMRSHHRMRQRRLHSAHAAPIFSTPVFSVLGFICAFSAPASRSD